MFDNKHPDVIEKERFQHFYLNYLKWTETITIVLSLMKTENAVDVVKWALVVDLILGARLAGEVRSGFQERTVGSVKTFAAPTWLRVELLGKTKSEIALPELLKVLEHSDSGLRGIAAEAIGEIGSESAIPDLLKAIEDSDLIEDSRLYGLPVCFIAAHAIGKIGSEAAIPVLLKALEHPCDDVYRSAAIAIGKIGSEIAIQGLLKALEHSESYVRMTAAEAIGKIGSKAAIPGLLKVLEDSDPDVCRNAAWALGEIGSEAAIPALLKAMKGSDVIEDYGVPMYFVAANAIGKIGSEAAIPALLKAIEDSDANVRISAAMAIKKIGFEATIPACVKAIEDSDSDVDWSEADVISINEEAFIEILLEIVEHSDLHARSNAVNSLSNYKNDRAAHILSNLLQLLPTESGKEAFQAIQAIQINCKFYNYEIEQQAEEFRKADRASLGGGGGDRSPNIIVQGDYIAGDKIQGDKIEGDKYNIDRIGNLNTGTVNIHGNQNGEQ